MGPCPSGPLIYKCGKRQQGLLRGWELGGGFLECVSQRGAEEHMAQARAVHTAYSVDCSKAFKLFVFQAPKKRSAK